MAQKKVSKKTIKTIKTKSSTTGSTPKAKARRSKRTTVPSSEMPLIFNKQNYLYMGIGVAVMGLGFLLMSGGGSNDPSVFDADKVYSFRRITLAPFVIIVGLLIEIYAIFKK